MRRVALASLLLPAAASAALAVSARVVPVSPAARLNALLLRTQAGLGAAAGRATLAAPRGPVLAPGAFADLVRAQQAARLTVVAQRAAKLAAIEAAAPAATLPVPIAAEAAAQPLDRRQASGEQAQGRAAADPQALDKLDALTEVDVHAVSEAVETVLGGLTPAKVGAMSDEEFSAGAERVLALLESRAEARRRALGPPERGPATPEKIVAYLEKIAPDLQRLANEVMSMDPADPLSCAACGPVSLGLRGPLRGALQRHFPDAPIDVSLEVGRLDGPGEPVPHVFLKVVSRRSQLLADPLAVIDFTAAQKPGNLGALGRDPAGTLILPWSSDIYEKRYPFMRPGLRGAGEMIERIERARGPLSQELERRAERLLGAP